MKSFYFLLLMSIVTITSCVKQEPIPQAELTGIWKLNGYQSSNYKMEFTQDGHVIWWNYNDIFNKTQEFVMEYDINKNYVKLCKNSNSWVRHQFKIYRNRKGGLYFSIAITGTDVDGNTITNTDTYYKMN